MGIQPIMRAALSVHNLYAQQHYSLKETPYPKIMSTQKPEQISGKDQQIIDFRNALGSFTTGITIVTAVGRDGQNIGMTANSFNSVSLDPALVLWSIAKDSSCFEDFMAAKSFAIHILSDEQQELSNRFAKSGADKFADVECLGGLSGVPILPHYSACFQCSLEHQYEGGDHIILVGKVLEFVDNGHNPLVFYRGQYSAI